LNDSWAPGNSGPLRLDDNQAVATNWRANCDVDGTNGGDNEYSENIVDGSECGYSLGDEVQTKPGNTANPPGTCTIVDDMLLGYETETIPDVFTDTDGDGLFEVVDVTNPHYGLVPIVYVPPGSSGASTVILRQFVPVFIHSCERRVTGSSGNGSKVVITITPVKSEVYVSGIEFVEAAEDQNFPEDWPLFTIKLID